MTDTTDAAVIAAATAQTSLDKITDRLLSVADKIGEQAGPAGKAAWEVTMAAVRIDAVARIGIGLAAFVIGMLFLRYFFFRSWAILRDIIVREGTPEKRPSDDANGVFSIICMIVGCVLAAIFSLCGMYQIFSSQNWVSAFSPEAGLALRIINGL